MEKKNVANCISIVSNRLLLVRKKGLWILPGGKRESGEGFMAALERECAEEIPGAEVGIIPHTGTVVAHGISAHVGYPITVWAYFCEVTGDMTPAAEISESRYVPAEDLRALPLSPITRSIVNKLFFDRSLAQNLVHPMPVLGLDFGGTLFTETGIREPMPGAFESVREIAAKFEGRAHIVSRINHDSAQPKILKHLENHRFWEATGIRPGSIRFCHKREEKAPICQELGITHFVDNRVEVLSHMADVPWKYAYSPTNEEMAKMTALVGQEIKVKATWKEITEDILAIPHA
jgi:ADP-ribose pyrophosphatase YjhB (NUDIX family)